jgi:hypothetical protein
LISVMVKYGVLFEVRTEFLNNIWTSFGFKGLSYSDVTLPEVRQWYFLLTVSTCPPSVYCRETSVRCNETTWRCHRKLSYRVWLN